MFLIILSSHVCTLVDSTVECLFVERVGKPQNWSAIGCDGLTPWSAGSSSLVPEPSPSAASRLCLSGWGGVPRHRQTKGVQVVPPYPLVCPCQPLPVGRCGGRLDAVIDGRGCQGSRFRGQRNDKGGAQEHLLHQRPSRPRQQRRRRHTVLLRSNSVIGPNPLPPALSSPPLQCSSSWSSRRRTAPSDLTRRLRHCPHPPSHSRRHGDGCHCRWQPKFLPRPPPQSSLSSPSWLSTSSYSHCLDDSGASPPGCSASNPAAAAVAVQLPPPAVNVAVAIVLPSPL